MKLNLSRVTPLPITEPVRARGRWLHAGSGRIACIGPHTWRNGPQALSSPPAPFSTQIAMALEYGCNAIPRIWVLDSDFEQFPAGVHIEPMPWVFRNGKYDLDRWDGDFFSRLRARGEVCLENRLLAGVMLFQAGHYEWATHPLNPALNHQGVDGGEHTIYTTSMPVAGWQRQAAYVERVMQKLDGLPNVFYEVDNEGGRRTLGWKRRVVDIVTSRGGLINVNCGLVAGVRPEELRATGADAVSINWPREFGEFDPEPPRGYPQFGDDDHLAPFLMTGDPRVAVSGVWSCFTRGLHPWQMDVYEGFELPGFNHVWNQPGHPVHAANRRALGQCHAYSRRMRLGRVAGSREGSGFALVAHDRKEFLVWCWEDEPFELDLPGGSFEVEWLNAMDSTIEPDGIVEGGRFVNFDPPRGRSVLYAAHADLGSRFPDEWLEEGPPPPPPPDEDLVVRIGRGRRMSPRDEAAARRTLRELEAGEEWVRMNGEMRFGPEWRRRVTRRLRRKLDQ